MSRLFLLAWCSAALILIRHITCRLLFPRQDVYAEPAPCHACFTLLPRCRYAHFSCLTYHACYTHMLITDFHAPYVLLYWCLRLILFRYADVLSPSRYYVWYCFHHTCPFPLPWCCCRYYIIDAVSPICCYHFHVYHISPAISIAHITPLFFAVTSIWYRSIFFVTILRLFLHAFFHWVLHYYGLLPVAWFRHSSLFSFFLFAWLLIRWYFFLSQFFLLLFSSVADTIMPLLYAIIAYLRCW